MNDYKYTKHEAAKELVAFINENLPRRGQLRHRELPDVSLYHDADDGYVSLTVRVRWEVAFSLEVGLDFDIDRGASVSVPGTHYGPAKAVAQADLFGEVARFACLLDAAWKDKMDWVRRAQK